MEAWWGILRPKGVILDRPARLAPSRLNTLFLLHVVQNVVKEVVFFACTARAASSGVALVPKGGVLLLQLLLF